MSNKSVAGMKVSEKENKDVNLHFIKNNEYFYKYSSKNELKTEAHDLVLGEIFSIKEKNIVIIITYNLTKAFSLHQFAILPISKITKSFVSDLREGSLFLVGDVLKCKVVMARKSEFVVRTDESGLGVVHTQCSFCYAKVSQLNNSICLNCKYINDRKYTRNYEL